MNDKDLFSLIERLRSFPKENDFVEFKVNDSEPFSLGETLCALSNSAKLAGEQYGYLIFGIDDVTHDVVGTDFIFLTAKKGNEELYNWLIRLMDPRPIFTPYQVEYDDKSVLVLEVGAANDRPVKFQGVARVRVGTYVKKLADYPEMERRLWSSSPSKFEYGLAEDRLNDDAILERIDYSKFLDVIRERLPDNKENLVRILEKNNLIKRVNSDRWSITNLGALVTAKDITSFNNLRRRATRVVFYDGTDKTNVEIDKTFTGGYAISFNEILSFIMDRVPANEAIKGAIRMETKMYPEIAVRELLANTLIHQDFFVSGLGITVDAFEDRIEFTNPGLPLIPIDRFIDSPSKLRNEALTWLMRQAHICEEGGQGIDRALKEVEFYQLPAPSFETSESGQFTRVILYGKRPFSDMNRADRVRACYQHCSLKYVAGQRATNETIRIRFGIEGEKSYVASKILSDAVIDGLVKLESGSSRKYAKYVPYWA